MIREQVIRITVAVTVLSTSLLTACEDSGAGPHMTISEGGNQLREGEDFPPGSDSGETTPEDEQGISTTQVTATSDLCFDDVGGRASDRRLPRPADACHPGEALCVDNSVVACNDTGTALLITETCGEGRTCVESEGVAWCQEWVCLPGQACGGDVLVECSADGLTMLASFLCDDANECAHSYCDPELGCVSEPLPDGSLCGNDSSCLNGICLSCEPSCAGVECGGDGCGGFCGECPEGSSCTAGWCLTDCLPSCAEKQCGGDGCGGSCGACDAGWECSSQSICFAICEPNCQGLQCGDDGCDGSCGGCPEGMNCMDGSCFPECQPHCTGMECGDDGCGGSCGECGEGECVDHLCEAVDAHCAGDADCESGQLCGPFSSVETPGTIETLCTEAGGGGQKGAGDTCDFGSECQSGYCTEAEYLDDYFCWTACEDDSDCSEGLHCYPNRLFFSFGTDTPNPGDDMLYGIPGCLPYLGTFKDCDSHMDCPWEEWCLPYANQTATGTEYHCTL